MIEYRGHGMHDCGAFYEVCSYQNKRCVKLAAVYLSDSRVQVLYDKEPPIPIDDPAFYRTVLSALLRGYRGFTDWDDSSFEHSLSLGHFYPEKTYVKYFQDITLDTPDGYYYSPKDKKYVDDTLYALQLGTYSNTAIALFLHESDARNAFESNKEGWRQSDVNFTMDSEDYFLVQSGDNFERSFLSSIKVAPEEIESLENGTVIGTYVVFGLLKGGVMEPTAFATKEAAKAYAEHLAEKAYMEEYKGTDKETLFYTLFRTILYNGGGEEFLFRTETEDSDSETSATSVYPEVGVLTNFRVQHVIIS